MTSKKEYYERLYSLSKEIATFNSIQMLLAWDQDTYMPSKAIASRSSQLSALSSLIHEKKASSAFGKELSQLIDLDSGEILYTEAAEKEKANLREWRRDYIHSTRLPNEFVKTFTELVSQSTSVWAEARKTNNFSLFAPHLEKIYTMSREKAEYLGYEEEPYNALLDAFEPQMKASTIEKLFSNLKKELVQLVQYIHSCEAVDETCLQGPFAREPQLNLGKEVFDIFDLGKGHCRLDESVHPFSTAMHPTDTRITSRILENSFVSNVLTILHECGHSLYERGLDPSNYGSPAGESVSLGIHESQSRWWETRIGRSYSFWKFFYPVVQKYFPQYKNVSLSTFWKAIHAVKPSFIRVEADEVTYSLHVILRFEIERDLLNKKLAVKDLPEAWNQKMVDLIGIKPENDRVGCLQDVHWSYGLIGYFPTYALGNLYAAQLFSTFEKKYPNWNEKVEKGDFVFIKEWLKENVHQYGRIYLPEELVQKASGATLSEKPFISYLQSKYKSIYENKKESKQGLAFSKEK